jgi:hypothetical protein
MTRWIAVSSGRVRATRPGQKSDSKSPCLHTGVSRRHEHLYIAAETLGLKPRPLMTWLACQFTHRPFLTTPKSSRLPLPVLASIPELSFSNSLLLCTLRITSMRNVLSNSRAHPVPKS